MVHQPNFDEIIEMRDAKCEMQANSKWWNFFLLLFLLDLFAAIFFCHFSLINSLLKPVHLLLKWFAKSSYESEYDTQSVKQKKNSTNLQNKWKLRNLVEQHLLQFFVCKTSWSGENKKKTHANTNTNRIAHDPPLLFDELQFFLLKDCWIWTDKEGGLYACVYYIYSH